MYFNNFPAIYYDFELTPGVRTLMSITDITKNTRVRNEILANISLYDEYDIKEGETPEIIAEHVYGNANYHWIVMLANERYDYINDFPLSSSQLDTFITRKYGVGNTNAPHHYVDANNNKVDSLQAGAASVSNYTYEDSINESKRRLKLISPSLITALLKNFRTL